MSTPLIRVGTLKQVLRNYNRKNGAGVDRPLRQRRDECVLVDDATAGGVDEHLRMDTDTRRGARARDGMVLYVGGNRRHRHEKRGITTRGHEEAGQAGRQAGRQGTATRRGCR